MYEVYFVMRIANREVFFLYKYMFAILSCVFFFVGHEVVIIQHFILDIVYNRTCNHFGK